MDLNLNLKMGQINCQQCIPSLEQNKQETYLKNEPATNLSSHLHRINILSKNRNSHQLFHKRHSTQITRQDTEQPTIQSKTPRKQNTILLVLQNSQRQLKLEIQNGNKIFIGTSINCHFPIQTKNKFKIAIQSINNQLYIKDMAVGTGSFIKTSLLSFDTTIPNLTELFILDNSFIQISIKHSENNIQVTFKNEQHKNQQNFIFKLMDIQLGIDNKKTFIVNQSKLIDFQIIKDEQDKFLMKFYHNNCWKYLDKRAKLHENQIILLGFEQFLVRRIFNRCNFYDSSDIKIIDQD